MRGAKWLQWDAGSGRATPGLAERGRSLEVPSPHLSMPGAAGGMKRGLPSTEGRGDSSVKVKAEAIATSREPSNNTTSGELQTPELSLHSTPAEPKGSLPAQQPSPAARAEPSCGRAPPRPCKSPMLHRGHSSSPGKASLQRERKSEQEDKALSFQQQISKEQTPVPWDSTNRSLSIATPRHRSWGSPVGPAVGSALLRSGAASPELQLEWFSKESACGSPDAAQTLQKLAKEHSPRAPQHSAANQQPPHLLPVSVLDFHCTTYCICLQGKEKPEVTRARGQPHCNRLCSGSGQLQHTFVLQLQLREPLLHLRSPWLVPGVNTLA
ncbi:hypothetical protein Anapl_10095 [Anas platyrhynchos]|uniref:Uncharacterized protein n=1 Tax=Anas platyrhynchos TaxID=8839 RepID=R0JUC0_ANAPL|nr:hypothetical protein Anapl_10095 [Anas platyrhynchos]